MRPKAADFEAYGDIGGDEVCDIDRDWGVMRWCHGLSHDVHAEARRGRTDTDGCCDRTVCVGGDKKNRSEVRESRAAEIFRPEWQAEPGLGKTRPHSVYTLIIRCAQQLI